MSNYFISKDNKSGEVIYLEYDSNGYKVTPKAKKKDAITVNKIVFVSPDLTKKIIKKKIGNKVSKLLLEFSDYDESSDDDNSTRLRDKLMEAERLKLNIINKYSEYLGKSYSMLSLKKIQIIIDGYRSKLYEIRNKKQKEIFMDMLSRANMESSEKKGRGR